MPLGQSGGCSAPCSLRSALGLSSVVALDGWAVGINSSTFTLRSLEVNSFSARAGRLRLATVRQARTTPAGSLVRQQTLRNTAQSLGLGQISCATWTLRTQVGRIWVGLRTLGSREHPQGPPSSHLHSQLTFPEVTIADDSGSNCMATPNGSQRRGRHCLGARSAWGYQNGPCLLVS